jgi:hypothetical protein
MTTNNSKVGANLCHHFTFKTVADRLLLVAAQVNVHSYYGLEPYRNNAKRRELRALLGAERRLFVSEYGDGDVSGRQAVGMDAPDTPVAMSFQDSLSSHTLSHYLNVTHCGVVEVAGCCVAIPGLDLSNYSLTHRCSLVGLVALQAWSWHRQSWRTSPI